MKHLAILAAALLATAPAAKAQLETGADAPRIVALDVNDQKVDVAEMVKEEPNLGVVLFFSLDAGTELADRLAELDEEDAAHVVAIGCKADREALKAFAEQHDLPYVVVPNSDELEERAGYGPVTTLPITVFVSSDLKVLKVLHGGGEGQADVVASIAQLYLQRRDTERARQLAAKASDEREASEIMGHAALFEGKLDEAEAAFAKIDSPGGKARVALERGDYERAASIAAEAEDDGYAQAVRGMALRKAGEPGAEEAFKRATELPAEQWQTAEAWTGLGQSAQYAGKVDEALGHYQKALALDAYNVTALSNEGAAHRQMGQLEQAAQTLQTADVRAIADPLTRMMLAQIQADLAARTDADRSERMRAQIESLEERYREQKAAGTDRPEDEWTSRPMVVAFLPSGESDPFFERAGTNIVLRREVASRLNEDARIQVVEREMIERLLEELDLGSSDLADPATQARLGQVLAAQLLGFIDFTGSPTANAMWVRLVNTETTAIEHQVMVDLPDGGEVDEAVDESVSEMAMAVREEHPLRGLVAAVEEDGTVLINLGANHGVKEGLVFDVVQNGETIEVGGRTLQRAMREIGQIRVTSVEDELSVCTIEEGGGMEKGMKVREQIEEEEA
jgi:tetratricopeptide (TPR) repeat protein